jgi:uncharacterized protein YxeA
LKKVLIIMMIVLLAPLTATVYADGKGKGASKHYEEQRREEMKHRQEQERESRKFQEERQREYDKHRREMEREERKRWEEEHRELGKDRQEREREYREGNEAYRREHRNHPDDRDRYRGSNRSRDQYRHYFRDLDRSPIDRYYADQFRRGKCPPGLVKKGNGCMPPGLAKKWTLYRPLPGDVIFHDLPGEVRASLGPPPGGHRFVRVAGDILLITVGSGMVIDAIEDLGRIY